MKALLVAAAVLGFSHVAHARDHMELVCSAVGDAKDGGDKIPLFIHMFESRASDGTSRDEVLSTIYQGVLFQASHLNKTGGFSTKVKISLDNGKATRFRGTYSLVQAGNGYALKLAGEVNDEPSAKEFRAVTATLKCVDLSI
jgi:opacity protein-like surface antigen